MKPIMQKLGVTVAMLSIYLSASAQAFKVDGIYYNIIDPAAKEVEVTSDYSEGYSGEIVLPSSVSYNGENYNVTAIGKMAFVWCTGLTAITIPNSVTAIGESAFSECSGLTTITIPNSVTTIENKTFEYCSGLTTITLSNTVTTIGDWAFNGCRSLTTIAIPNTVTTIGDRVFNECNSLTKIDVADDNQAYSSKEGILYNKLQTTMICCPRRKIGDIIVPNTVTTIENSAFEYCRSLTSITIPNTVTTIGDNTFTECSSLTKIDVAGDNQAYSSKDGILYDKLQETLICCPCGKAGEIIIPNTVMTIGNGAFSGCSGLTTITLPNTVTTIGDGSFSGCSSLTSIALPNSVTAIGKNTFARCSGLTSIALPNTVTTIEEGTFSLCSGLTTIVLPNTVTTIGSSAFQNCNSLTTITLPNTVTTIGDYTFYFCRGLRSIASLAGTPPECGNYVFGAIDKQKCTLYVPAGSLEAYRQAPGWKDFNLVEESGTGIDSIEAVSAAAATEVFNLAGEKVADTIDNLPAGIYIVREGMTSRKIIVR